MCRKRQAHLANSNQGGGQGANSNQNARTSNVLLSEILAEAAAEAKTNPVQPDKSADGQVFNFVLAHVHWTDGFLILVQPVVLHLQKASAPIFAIVKLLSRQLGASLL